jgi:hypothetical protein
MRPWGSVELSGRFGQADLKAGEYTVSSGPLPENPLLRKFNQTDRDRDFAEARLGWSPGAFSVAVEGTYAFDDFTKSSLGLTSSRDYRYAGTASWAVNEKASVYVTGSYQNIVTDQAGEETFVAYSRPWAVRHEDEFMTAGGGIVWKKVAEKFDVALDYVHAESQGAIDTAVAGTSPDAGPFPELDSLRLSVGYDVNPRLRVTAAWTWEDYDSADWQTGGVGPATLANLLGMSPDPYKYSVNVVGLSFSYRFGGGPMDPME